jgi:SAM-dependent methyltransferase
MRDILFMGGSQSDHVGELMTWMETQQQQGLLHEFVPDYHRLQEEHWLWTAHRDGRIHGDILDIGVENRRDWMGEGYKTLNLGDDGDLKGSAELMPIPDDAFDTVVCTEVLEHTLQPWMAVAEGRRILKPGGRLFVSSPFFWAWHGRPGEFRDYWRFTEEGWDALLAGFTSRAIRPFEWTGESRFLYDLMRRFEGFGFRGQSTAATGYLCEAVK